MISEPSRPGTLAAGHALHGRVNTEDWGQAAELGLALLWAVSARSRSRCTSTAGKPVTHLAAALSELDDVEAVLATDNATDE